MGVIVMNSREILDKKFDKTPFGYKTEEVEDYLREVAQYVDSVNKEKAVLEKKIQILADRINEYRKDEESMKEALLGAQRLGNTVVSEAKEKAEKLLADAQEKADKMLSDAEKEASRAVTGIKLQTEKEQQTLLKMQREVSNFKTRLLSIYKSHLDLITALPEEEKEPVKEEVQTKEQPEQKAVEQKPVQPESVKSELAKINKRQDDIIRFIRHYEEEQLNPMIRVTNSIALRFDVIGKTLETLMDKQLMKTTVNDELSSEKNMPERKSVLRQENYLIIPLKTFFGDTLGGGYAFAFCSKPIHNK